MKLPLRWIPTFTEKPHVARYYGPHCSNCYSSRTARDKFNPANRVCCVCGLTGKIRVSARDGRLFVEVA